MFLQEEFDIDGDWVLRVFVMINIIGFFLGLLFYLPQLSENPQVWQIPFIIDCPLYALLFAIVIVLRVVGMENKELKLITSVGCMKYGIWTLFALAYFGFPGKFSIPLFIAHIGLFLEGLFLIGRAEVEKMDFILLLAWFLLNDFLDYGYNLHPPLPSVDIFVEAFAYFLTFSLVFGSHVLSRKSFDLFKNTLFVEIWEQKKL